MTIFRHLRRSARSFVPVIFALAALFPAAAPLQAVVPVELAPNPNPAGNTIDTPVDIKPIPIPPDVTSFNNGNFTNHGTVNFYGSFDNNGTVNNYGTLEDVIQFIDHNNNPGAVINNMAGAYMDLGNGRLNNAAGATLNNYGRFNDAVGYAGLVYNCGTIRNYAGGFYHNQTRTENFGTFINDGLYHGWVFKNSGTVINNGTFNHWSGIVENKTGATFLNNGTMTTDAWFGHTQGIDNRGTFINSSGASLTNNIDCQNRTGGTWTNAGTMTNNGTLTLESGSAFTNTGSITNNGAMSNNAGSTLTNSGTIRNSAGHTFTNTGTFTSTGTLSNAGTLNNTGTLEMSGHDLTGGTLNNNAGGTLALRGNFTFGAAAAGTVNLNAGSMLQNYATLTNPAGNTQTNNGTLVNAGTLVNNGTINGAGTLVNNGTFAGSGDTGNNVQNNGTIAAGNSIGTLTIIGNYTQNPGSALQVELSPTQADKLVVTGTATLNGGTVQLLPTGLFVANKPYTYTILTAAGGVTGAFANLANTSAFLADMYLAYLPAAVDLTFTRRSLQSVCETENQCAVAGGLEGGYTVATGDLRNIIDIVFAMNARQARNAYDQMGGYIHAAVPAVTFSSYNQYRDTMARRMAGFVSGGPTSMLAVRPVLTASRTDTGSDAQTRLLAAANNTTPGTGTPAWGFWIDTYGSMGERRATDVSSRYDSSTAGAVFGFDKKITPSLLLGASVGYAYNKADLKDLSEDARMSSYQGSLYGIYTKGPWYAGGIGSYSYNAYDTSRDMAFGTIARTANASYNSHLFAGYLEGGYKLVTRYVDIIPFAAFQATYLTRGSFSEDGAGALSLDADKETTSSYLASLGVRLRKDYTIPAGTLSPELRVRWDHEFSNDNHSLRASFTGYPQTAFTVNADRPDRDRLAAGVGITLKTKDNLYINLSYDGYFSGDTTRHSGMVGLQFKF